MGHLVRALGVEAVVHRVGQQVVQPRGVHIDVPVIVVVAVVVVAAVVVVVVVVVILLCSLFEGG